jgi:DNA-directed RNA polymerase specialized sigma24 family protein
LDYRGEREEITTPHLCGAKGGEHMKDSYEQRIQNQFGAFCVRVLKNEARHIQRDYANLLDQEKSLDELTASELEQTAVWDDYFMDEHVFEVLGLPVVVTGNVLANALAQLPEDKRDVILLSYFLEMTDREISKKLNIVHQTVSKRRLVTLKELREYLMKEGFEWPDK